MSTDYLDHDEIDASKVFRQSASDLISVKDLDMVLERFGYSKNDRIDRRELCMMYGTVKKNMEEEIGRLAHTSQYEDAKEMRQRLTKLRNEFDNLQTNAIKSSHNDQTKQIEKASHIIEKSLKTELKSQESNVNEYCKVIEKNQQKYHNIENENFR
jgi:phage host-nuclease inhibitor protein Gam